MEPASLSLFFGKLKMQQMVGAMLPALTASKSLGRWGSKPWPCLPRLVRLCLAGGCWTCYLRRPCGCSSRPQQTELLASGATGGSSCRCRMPTPP